MPEVGTDFVIERAHCVGRPDPDSKRRKIVAHFLNYKDREAVFKAKKLHGTNMFVNEDYSDRVIKKQTELMPKLKEARRKNQRAFLRFDKLVIYDNPDLNNQNYSSLANYCNYKTAEDLNGVIGGNNLISFSLFHLNAHSLVKNQDALAHLLANINHKFSVLAITETLVKDSNVNDLSFEGYNFVSNHRAYKIGGGVGLFIDQNFSYKILREFNVSDANIIESLFIEICIPRHKNVIIGVIYCPPSENTLEFVEKVNEIILGVTKGNKNCCITGDFNLDLLKHESHSVTAQFIELLFAFSFLPMITKPTQITAHSATLIDNIFMNNTTVSSKNGLIISDISDHVPIFSNCFW